MDLLRPDLPLSDRHPSTTNLARSQRCEPFFYYLVHSVFPNHRAVPFFKPHGQLACMMEQA
jgi:hypothetical protein